MNISSGWVAKKKKEKNKLIKQQYYLIIALIPNGKVFLWTIERKALVLVLALAFDSN